MPRRIGWESRLEIKRKVGIVLGLVPRGTDNHGQPYFDLNSKQGLYNILFAAERLKAIGSNMRKKAVEYEKILEDVGYDFEAKKF